VVKLEKMTRVAIQVLLLALVLAIGNSLCALNCSTQDCHGGPPCHQHRGVAVCQNALPVADVGVAAVSPPALVTVSGVPEVIIAAVSVVRSMDVKTPDCPSPHILRI
jgi:hypothetical protein